MPLNKQTKNIYASYVTHANMHQFYCAKLLDLAQCLWQRTSRCKACVFIQTT